MSEAVESPDKTGADPAGGSRRRNVALVVLVAVAAFLAGMQVPSVDYQPIKRGNFWQGVSFEGPGLEEVTPLHPDSRSEVHLPYQSGARISYGFTIRNDGRWPITVTDVPLSDVLFAEGERLRMGVGIDLIGGAAEPLVDFRPFRLPSGSQRYVELTYRFNDCALPPDDPARANSFGWDMNRVDYDVFGIPRHHDLKIDPLIRFRYRSKGYVPGCEPTNGSR